MIILLNSVLNIPDFDGTESFEDTDFSDMFKDDAQFTSDSIEGDTTLTTDELQNLTDSMTEMPVEEVNNTDDIDFSAFEEPASEQPAESSESLKDLGDITQDFMPEEEDLALPQEDAPAESEIDLSAFETPVTETVDESAGFADIPAGDETEEVSLDSFEEVSFDDFDTDSSSAPAAENEEVSLDDFMSDSGSGSTEEVSLDDFMDISDFDAGPKPQKEEAIVDEKPLDMDISFDSSAENVETEDNSSINEEILDDDTETEEETSSAEFEEVSFDTDFETSSSGSNDIEAESVDLSAFGIDSDAEETPVTQDVEASKIKDQVVDYDLSVDNDNAASAPVVGEIKSSAASEETKPAEENAVQSAPVQAVDSGILEQIVAELAGLKEEINTLKTNLEEIKANSGATAAEPSIEEDIIPETTEPEQSSGGFFDSIGEDDTIALSTDELNNIMNTADFSSDEIVVEPSAEEAVTDETVTEEIVTDEVPAEEPVVEESFTEETVEDVVTEDTIIDDSTLEEPVIEETAVEEPVIEETITDDFTTEEPVFDEEVTEEQLPDEITIPVEDETEEEPQEEDNNALKAAAIAGAAVLGAAAVATALSDKEEPVEDKIIEETPVEEEVFGDFGTEEVTEETVTEETTEDDTFGTTDDIFDVDFSEEPAAETTDDITIEEPVSDEITEEDNFFESTDSIFDIPETEEKVEETVVETTEEPVFDETPAEETTEESPLEETTFDEIITEEPASEDSFTEDEAFGTTDDIFDINFDDQEAAADEPVAEEPVVEETISEPVIEETVEEESVVEESISDDIIEEDTLQSDFAEETSVTDEEVMADTSAETVEDDFVSVDQNINNLSASNIDYLTTKENNVDEDDENAELKKDIKSVLLYMDQLLENLPEEKIVEFAKSEEFATYKKLFSELGLS